MHLKPSKYLSWKANPENILQEKLWDEERLWVWWPINVMRLAKNYWIFETWQIGNLKQFLASLVQTKGVVSFTNFGFILCPSRTMEYISFGSFLIALSQYGRVHSFSSAQIFFLTLTLCSFFSDGNSLHCTKTNKTREK